MPRTKLSGYSDGYYEARQASGRFLCRKMLDASDRLDHSDCALANKVSNSLYYDAMEYLDDLDTEKKEMERQREEYE